MNYLNCLTKIGLLCFLISFTGCSPATVYFETEPPGVEISEDGFVLIDKTPASYTFSKKDQSRRYNLLFSKGGYREVRYSGWNPIDGRTVFVKLERPETNLTVRVSPASLVTVTQNSRAIKGNWNFGDGIAVDSNELWKDNGCLDFTITAKRPYYEPLQETRELCIGDQAEWKYRLIPMMTTVAFHSKVSGAAIELPQFNEQHKLPCEIVLEPDELAQLFDDPANPYSDFLYLEVVFHSSEGKVKRDLKIEPGKKHELTEKFE
jgi:hypothetical protein